MKTDSMESDHRRQARRAPTVSRKGCRTGTDSEHRGQAHRAHSGHIPVEGRRTSECLEGRYGRRLAGKHRGQARQTVEEHALSPKIWSINRRALKHIEQNHMFRGKEGKSVFIATKLCDVWALVNKAMKCPDHVGEDRSNDQREVYLKSFATPVGVDGLLRCYTIKVVYDRRNNQVITAYPTFSNSLIIH